MSADALTDRRRASRRLGFGLLASAGFLLLGAGADAQSFLGSGAPRALAVPNADPAAAQAQPVPDPAPLRPVRPDVAEPVAATTALPVPQRPLPAVGGSLRLSGEESSLQWPVYLTDAQTRERLRFRIGYLSAISVVPHESFLTASVNDVVIGRTEIKAPGAVRIIEFEVPPGLLKPGYNAVTIAGSQRHRVDCSLQATFELWTQIDPSWTGFVVPQATEAGGLRGLPAVMPDARGIVPIRVVLGNRPAFAGFERILAVLQHIALAGRFSQVAVDFGPALSGRAGLNLVVGGSQAEAAGSQPLSIEPAQADRPLTLVLAGDGPAEMDAAIQALRAAAAAEPVGSPQGLQAFALARGVPTRGGETLRLSALGVSNREFSGRLFRTGFDVVLPTDFVPADYAKVNLRLAGGYAAGLDVGAQVIVDINGRNVASLPMPRSGGDVFQDAQLALPLGRWRPGRNRIEVSAFLPAQNDRVCEDGTERKRFLFLSDSTLTFPNLARAVRLPDLAATLGDVPRLAQDRRPRLVVPAPDRDAMAAAATIVVQMALAANRAIDFELVADQGRNRQTPTIVVAPARALDPDTLRAVGLNPDQIRQIWQGRAAAGQATETVREAVVDGLSLDRLRSNVLPACALPAAAPRNAVAASQRIRVSSADNEGRELASAWSVAVRPQNTVGGYVSDLSSRFATATEGALRGTAAWLSNQVQEPEIEIGPQASLVVSQGVSGRDMNSLVTVFTAPNAATLAASAICLTAPAIWNRLEGRTVSLDADTGTLAQYDAKQAAFFETGGGSFENMRLVMAGWFSTNPTFFALILFAAAVTLGLSTTAMLRGVGRNNPGRQGAAAGTETETGEGSR
jgi:hypothetical protein